jgi:hypothetical protein
MRATLVRIVLAVAAAVAFVSASTSTSQAAGEWHGFVGGNSPNVRSAPSTSAPIVGTLTTGSPIAIQQFVHGERVSGVNETWAEIAPGQYVYSAFLVKLLPSAPPAPPRTFSGRWIDANLTEQILTAYDGSTPQFWAVMSSGAPGTDSPTGVFPILRRVANETMSSATLAEPVEIPYYLTNVLYTQYFTDYGAAIHDNWWKGADSPFGVPTSHACLGLREADALKFWNFAGVGTVVNLHY